VDVVLVSALGDVTDDDGVDVASLVDGVDVLLPSVDQSSGRVKAMS
jgi:hypothetical protein